MGKSKILMGVTALVLGLGLPLTVAASAFAEEGTWSFVTPNGAVVPIQTAEDGSQFWDFQVEGTGSYIGSWSRKTGRWTSGNEALTAANNYRSCYTNAKESYVNRFDTYDAFNNAATTQGKDNEDGSHSWWVEGDAEIDVAFAACEENTEWSNAQVTSSKDEATGITTFHVPLSVYGSGTHSLFIQNLYYPDDTFGMSCKSRTWDGGGKASMGCEYSEGYFERITVNVEYPMADSGHVVAGPQVTRDTWFDQGVYSDLTPIDWNFFGNFQKFAGPVAATLGVTSVFAVLIALPTALVESSLEANHGRVESLLRKYMPGYKRRQEKMNTDSQQNDSNTGEK
ncbi:hypothetical protein M2119_000609 [Aurantimicrobium minutum]|uniref:hypothetical protein n=1 Tax=Aurantimicrobium minutum TaxID=708131 RepID=UPI00247413D6|nr:hypothetical protein [Aurantimicrobium minutum]MDH6532372.1 hypothetical protein [Aurantimicrobium minutum]